jgi:hypothetical protein
MKIGFVQGRLLDSEKKREYNFSPLKTGKKKLKLQ